MNKKRIGRIAQVTLATAMAFTITGIAEAKDNPSHKIILVTPSELPELARVNGEAMLLRETNDGRTLLYIEQGQGARLAVLDVTDPAKVKEESTAQINASGPFDFVSSLGHNQELVHFRDGRGDAVLNFRNAKSPTLNTVPGLDLQGSVQRLGNAGFIVADQPLTAPADPNYEVVALSNSTDADRVYDVNQVRQQITNQDTGTTFLLTADGLYLVRRPAIEQENDIHEWQMSHPG
jgi:hypothetical protein